MSITRKILIAGATVLIAGAATATAATPWRVVKSSTTTGVMAMTSIDATVRHPAQLAVRATGHITGNSFGWVCTRGYNVQSDFREVDKPGLFTLTRIRGADSCKVNASIVGTGRVTVQVLKR